MFNEIFPVVSADATQKIVDIAKGIEGAIDPSVIDSEPDDSLTKAGRVFDSEEAQIESPRDLNSLNNKSEAEDVYRSAIGTIEDQGFDAIAFYKSFRFVNNHPAPGYWGIFYIKNRVQSLVAEMSADIGVDKKICLDAVLRFLYGHEIYHYKVDALCLQQEAASNGLIYRPYRSYVNQLPLSKWFEESVANYYGFSALNPLFNRRTRSSHDYGFEVKDYVKNLILLSPGAYAFGLDQSVLHRSGARGNLANQIVIGRNYLNQLPVASSQLFEDVVFKQLLLDGFRDFTGDSSLVTDLSLKNCPVNFISWYKNGSLVPALTTIPLREMKEGFIKSYLNGRLDRVTNHEYYVIDNGETIKLPNGHDKDVRVYEFKNILDKAGIKVVDFWQQRNRTNKWKKNVPRSKGSD